MHIASQINDLIDQAFDTPARRWILSPEVTAWCEKSRKEREAEETAAEICLPLN